MGSWGEASSRCPSGSNLTVVFRGSYPTLSVPKRLGRLVREQAGTGSI